jgi:hypothetical protein
VPALAQLRPRGLGVHPVAQLGERQAEQVADADQVGQAGLVLRVVETVGALLAPARRQQAELLVVAHRARRGADAAGELADAEALGAGGGAGFGRDIHLRGR